MSRYHPDIDEHGYPLHPPAGAGYTPPYPSAPDAFHAPPAHDPYDHPFSDAHAASLPPLPGGAPYAYPDYLAPVPGAPAFPQAPGSPVPVVEDTSYGPDPTAPRPGGTQLYDPPYAAPGDLGYGGDEPLGGGPRQSQEWEAQGLLRGHTPGAESIGGPVMPGGFIDPEQSDDNNIRYGRIPQRVPRRYKTTKRIPLFQGNLVLDCPVPSKVLAGCRETTDREFTNMRYTAATCDPHDFKKENYTLRQQLYSPPRRTEIFIVLTMYNEEEFLYARTMDAVIQNVVHLCSRSRSKTWGDEGWKKVVVCIVSDGRQKINSRTLSCIAAQGIYQDGVAKNVVQGKQVTAHIYEYTTQISVKPDMTLDRGSHLVPVQVIFCLKEKNQKKINSHRWFFSAFAEILEPNVCVLLDVGTSPGTSSIYHLWKSFDLNSNVGGACGEIVAYKGRFWSALLNPLVAAQNFEYKMSNILDKPLESVFGYITVLPGAFSAYRWHAIQNDENGQGPLEKYFLGEKMHGGDAGIFTANMYLAEDRILCWELVAKRKSSWVLHYVKSAYAFTDVPDQIPELVSQRRRWLNGSFFAAIHSTVHFGYIYRSAHSFWRKLWIHVELLYQVYNLIFSWFALANYYISFMVLTRSMESPSFKLKGIRAVNIILQYLYVALLALCFLQAMGNRPQGSKVGYAVAFIGFAVITIYMTAAAVFLAVRGIQGVINTEGASAADLFKSEIFNTIVVSLLATAGLYLLSSLLFFEPWHMITSFFQYLLLAPSYINVLNVYAFCNTHDISWGTKGDNRVHTDLGVVASKPGGKDDKVDVVVPTDKKDIDAAYEDALHTMMTDPPKMKKEEDAETKQKDYYATFRTNVVLAWVLSNAFLVAAILSTTGLFAVGDDSNNDTNALQARATSQEYPEKTNVYMKFVLYSVAGLALVRFIGATTYLVLRLFNRE